MLNGLHNCREPVKVSVVARVAETIATLTTVGGPLETVVTLRPLDSLFFINTTTTENLCTRNGVGATDARHLGWIKKYRVGCLFLIQIYPMKVYLLNCFVSQDLY